MKTLALFIGNIASGKTTKAKELHHCFEDLIINADSLRTMFGGGNYIFDPQIEENVIHDTCLFLTEQLLKLGKPIVVDETNMKISHREKYIKLAKKYNYQVIAYIFPNYGKEEHVRRRMYSDSRGYDQSLWEEVYDKIQSKFEEPTYNEGFDLILNIEKEQHNEHIKQ